MPLDIVFQMESRIEAKIHKRFKTGVEEQPLDTVFRLHPSDVRVAMDQLSELSRQHGNPSPFLLPESIGEWQPKCHYCGVEWTFVCDLKEPRFQ